MENQADYKNLSDMNDEEYQAYLNGYNFALTHEKDSVDNYDHNLFMCFSQGFSDGKTVQII